MDHGLAAGIQDVARTPSGAGERPRPDAQRCPQLRPCWVKRAGILIGAADLADGTALIVVQVIDSLEHIGEADLARRARKGVQCPDPNTAPGASV